jgi:hypothetical protein
LTLANTNSVHNDVVDTVVPLSQGSFITLANDQNMHESPDPTTTPGKDSSAGAKHSSEVDNHTTQDVHDPTTTPDQESLTGVLFPLTADNQHSAYNKTAPTKSSDGPWGKKWKVVMDENIKVWPSSPQGKKWNVVTDENISPQHIGLAISLCQEPLPAFEGEWLHCSKEGFVRGGVDSSEKGRG